MSEHDNPTLFPDGLVIGSFKGFAERGFEFAADLVIPYRSQEIARPQLGQFILVELSNADEAALGRITKMTPTGLLASAEGEDYIEKMREREEAVPEDLKQRKLKYRVQVKLLGALRRDPFRFAPSQRRLPHLGARVAWPSPAVLKKLCGLGCAPDDERTDLGDFALGEFIYSGAKKNGGDDVHLEPQLSVDFNIRNLIARRTAVFARAGYGKSNLMKYLVSALYEKEPRTDDGRAVGTLIFDADGEYFWPNEVNNRPGLCDVPHLKDKLAVFTGRRARDDAYDNWTVGGVKLDLRTLKPGDVLSIALSPERLEQQNVRKMMFMPQDRWSALVDMFASSNELPDNFSDIGKLLGYKTSEQIRNNSAEIGAAISNINTVVRLLHDPESRLVIEVPRLLEKGHVVVVDLSLLSSSAGEKVSGLLLRNIFSKNQEMFTSRGKSPLPVITVIEEAQRVLGAGRMDETSPFVEWVKEGRKYDLGAVLVTQQPGAISGQLLSQVDNWFCFHLLSQGDAGVLGKYNSHFSNDILSHMIAEPIVGNCFMWSAPHQPFVLPVKVRSFDAMYPLKQGAKPDAPKVPRSEELANDEANEKKTLADKLVKKMRGPQTRLTTCSDDESLRGIYEGQLFVFIQEIAPDKTNDEVNRLKSTLFKQILSVAPVLKDSGGKAQPHDYCAPIAEWEKVLGRKLKDKSAAHSGKNEKGRWQQSS